MNGLPTEAEATKALVKGVTILILAKLSIAVTMYTLGRWARNHA